MLEVLLINLAYVYSSTFTGGSDSGSVKHNSCKFFFPGIPEAQGFVSEPTIFVLKPLFQNHRYILPIK